MHCLGTLAQRQDGLFTRAQALACGYSPRQIGRRLTSGEWTAAQPRVYRVGGAPPTWRSQVLAATLSVAGAVASHATAAALLGLERVADHQRVEVCVQGRSLPLLHDVSVHRTLALEPCDRAVVDGIPSTSGARTVVDLAARLAREDLTALVDDAVCARVTGRSWLCRRARALDNGRRGTGVIVGLTEEGAEGTFRSWLERRASQIFAAGGLPAPVWNTPLRQHGRLLGVVDALWSPPRLVVELDGLRFHASPRQRRRDHRRANLVTIAGYRLLRYSWLDIVGEPDRVVAEIREALHPGGLSSW